MAIVKRLTKRGFTLIELMIVVVIIGVLASLAIYGVQRYVANSKSAEARMMLGKISKDVLTVYEGEKMDGGLMAAKDSRASSQTLCESATDTIPASKGAIAGSKYQPDVSEWRNGSKTAGWLCVGTSITTPIYYMYGYTSDGAAGTAPAAGDGFVATAKGDLDGDGELSTFTMEGEIRESTVDNSLSMVLSPAVGEFQTEE